MCNILTLVLGGGQGTRLYPLTKLRSKPAVPLAGKYRLIDIPLSNCINSGLNRILVLTQFMSVSLHRHISQTYKFDQFDGGFVEALAAQQTLAEGSDWYQGTADAVRKNIRYIQEPGTDLVLILSGDQLYRMDFRKMVKTHKESGADVTIAAMPVARKDAPSLGIMRTDDSGRVVGFLEKPQTDAELDNIQIDPAWIDQRGIESKGRNYLASMGIYLFNRDTLVDALEKTDYEDFGREIFPASIRSKHVQMHLFDDYWEDIGTIRAFYEANLALAQDNPPFAISSEDSPIYSHPRFLPPSKINESKITNSLIADGCNIGKDVIIENSVIGLRCKIGRGVTIRNSVLMGADYFENDQHPRLGIGSGTLIDGAIVDKNCTIGNNCRIINEQEIENSDGTGDVMIRDRIVIVQKGAQLPDEWKLPKLS